VVLGNLGRLEESLAAYDGALAVNPGVAGPLMSKAAALANARRFQEALTCFEKARELGDAEAVQGIIMCRQALGRPLTG
jgi:tetratricopeptide (TPR) repeat protein